MTILWLYIAGGIFASWLYSKTAPDKYNTPEYYEFRRVMTVAAFACSWFALIGIFVYLLVKDILDKTNEK